MDVDKYKNTIGNTSSAKQKSNLLDTLLFWNACKLLSVAFNIKKIVAQSRHFIITTSCSRATKNKISSDCCRWSWIKRWNLWWVWLIKFKTIQNDFTKIKLFSNWIENRLFFCSCWCLVLHSRCQFSMIGDGRMDMVNTDNLKVMKIVWLKETRNNYCSLQANRYYHLHHHHSSTHQATQGLVGTSWLFSWATICYFRMFYLHIMDKPE